MPFFRNSSRRTNGQRSSSGRATNEDGALAHLIGNIPTSPSTGRLFASNNSASRASNNSPLRASAPPRSTIATNGPISRKSLPSIDAPSTRIIKIAGFNVPPLIASSTACAKSMDDCESSISEVQGLDPTVLDVPQMALLDLNLDDCENPPAAQEQIRDACDEIAKEIRKMQIKRKDFNRKLSEIKRSYKKTNHNRPVLGRYAEQIVMKVNELVSLNERLNLENAAIDRMAAILQGESAHVFDFYKGQIVALESLKDAFKAKLFDFQKSQYEALMLLKQENAKKETQDEIDLESEGESAAHRLVEENTDGVVIDDGDEDDAEGATKNKRKAKDVSNEGAKKRKLFQKPHDDDSDSSDLAF